MTLALDSQEIITTQFISVDPLDLADKLRLMQFASDESMDSTVDITMQLTAKITLVVRKK